jgi:hypothetical protein
VHCAILTALATKTTAIFAARLPRELLVSTAMMPPAADGASENNT